MTRYYPDLGSASDWSSLVGNLLQPIRSTIQIWVVTRHQYGISALIYSEVILPGNQWWCREMSSVFSGYQTAKTRDHAANKREEKRPFLRCLDIGRSNVKVSDLPLRETI